MSESGRRNLFLALCALVLLHTGVHLSQSFINYPGWYVLEAESFKAYHYPMSIRAGILGAAPRLVELVLALVVRVVADCYDQSGSRVPFRDHVKAVALRAHHTSPTMGA
jgi:hypothetical protein